MSPGDTPKHRIDEELVSVDSLKHTLCTRCHCNDVKIHREEQDPPDFTVTIDGEAFPAEVTSIVSQQQSHAQCDHFAKAIQAQATSLAILSGKYAFIVSQLPSIPKPTSPDGRQLIERAIDYIDATRNQTAAPATQLTLASCHKISIMKLTPDGSSVSLVRCAPPMWQARYQCQLASLIQQAVDDKKRKLENVGIVSGRALLLLYDAFGYADPEDALSAIQQVSGCEWFHSIFWAASFSDRKNTTYPAQPGRNGLFLYSSNSDWHNSGTVSLETDT